MVKCYAMMMGMMDMAMMPMPTILCAPDDRSTDRNQGVGSGDAASHSFFAKSGEKGWGGT